MNPDNVFQKTAKGREEIEKRTLRIDHKRRTLLILVDARSSAAELAGKAAHIPDPMTLLQSLWTEGFVEPVGTPGTAAPAAAPVAPPSSGKSLDELKRISAKTIERLMGPDGDALAIKIERAPNLDAFFAEAARAREALRAFLGPRQAEEFWKSLGG
jgi:hypothetical protein